MVSFAPVVIVQGAAENDALYPFCGNLDMSSKGSSDRLAEQLHHVCRHWETRRQAAASHRAYTITISRQAGGQGTGVAHEVGRRLGWPVYDHELLERISQETGLRTSLLESIDEKRKGWLQEALESAMKIPMVSENAYAHQLVKIVLALGAHGECVIVGRGASHILPAATTLRVRLIAPLEKRAEVMSQQLGISRKLAEQQIAATDQERRSFVQAHFRKDPVDPENYDVIFNTAHFSTAECAGLIVDVLHTVQSRGPGQDMAILGASPVP